ncbi:hypothetical protein OS493_027743 [Desmophyllum pertusum]|uniref:Uncharacterized protein n=1 Tax=Desmophyllum pertusum TaxID=174260 RepID=A0A9W9ZAC2_9CNID|nr:hypothetical protein OS493_027743 [Desmophyllum pertusum]
MEGSVVSTVDSQRTNPVVDSFPKKRGTSRSAVSGQRLVYKFVDLPYNYKPIKNFYDSGILEGDWDDGKTKEKQETPREMFQVFSRQNYITTTTASEFKVPQEPIRSQNVIHVSQCCCNGASRGVKHISVPVIMKCGHPSALPRKIVPADGQALA